MTINHFAVGPKSASRKEKADPTAIGTALVTALIKLNSNTFHLIVISNFLVLVFAFAVACGWLA